MAQPECDECGDYRVTKADMEVSFLPQVIRDCRSIIGDYVHDEGTGCGACDSWLCDECLRRNTCSSDKVSYCSEDVVRCDDCDNPICDDCKSRCDVTEDCQKMLCNKCAAKCSRCNFKACGDHQRTCHLCDDKEITCSGCTRLCDATGCTTVFCMALHIGGDFDLNEDDFVQLCTAHVTKCAAEGCSNDSNDNNPNAKPKGEEFETVIPYEVKECKTCNNWYCFIHRHEHESPAVAV
jgi:hypothetical protein